MHIGLFEMPLKISTVCSLSVSKGSISVRFASSYLPIYVDVSGWGCGDESRTATYTKTDLIVQQRRHLRRRQQRPRVHGTLRKKQAILTRTMSECVFSEK
ncbi:hypothetical protein DPMN_151162 [Dreissena polymorpha]|uniref:Uncharacterized protein n=1 Tax=Dreissena polymorpha TaxID=45954 RepID=A0A9D4FH30_DREPO|nr:hypothetical protein DPMN_151162 [Dreissena polymorpha]